VIQREIRVVPVGVAYDDVVAPDREAASEAFGQERRTDDRVDLLAVVFEQARPKRARQRLGAPAAFAGAFDDANDERHRRAFVADDQRDVDPACRRAELDVVGTNGIDDPAERVFTDLHGDGIATVLQLAGDVEQVPVPSPLAGGGVRVLLFLGASILTGGAGCSLELGIAGEVVEGVA
jgi:hypothetical protein